MKQSANRDSGNMILTNGSPDLVAMCVDYSLDLNS